jgi:hypothetical protein
MNQLSRIEQARKDAKLRQEMDDRFNAIRKAWNLVEPDRYDRDPQWLRIAATRASKAGRLPRRIGGELVIMLLGRAGFNLAIDHPAIERVDGIRRVIFEPYESTCSMDNARRIAAELAILLECDASVSLCSWHYPGSTIRITLEPLPTFAPVATKDATPTMSPTLHTTRQCPRSGPHNASASTPQRTGPTRKNQRSFG